MADGARSALPHASPLPPHDDFLRAYVHPVLAVGLPFLFLQALDGVMRLGIIPGHAAGPFGMLVVVLLAGAGRAVSANILGRERISGAVPLMRELVLTLAACAVLLYLLTGRLFRGDLSPLDPALVWPLVLCAAQWFLTWIIQGALRARELFLRLIAGKTGHALVAAVHDAGGEAGQAHESFMRLQSLAVVLQIFAIVPWIILEAVGSIAGSPPLPFALTARIMINAVAGVLFLVILRGFADESSSRAAGVTQEQVGGSRRYGMPLAGVAALFVASAALAGGSSLAPLALIGRLLAWLNSLGRGVAASAAPPPAFPQQPEPIDPTAGLRDMVPAPQPSPVLDAILRIAGIVLAAAAAAGFLYFVVRPLLRRGLFTAARRFHPLRAAARTVVLLVRLLAGIPACLARWLRSPGTGLAAVPRAILAGLRDAAAANASAARVKEKAARVSRGRAMREFRRLARWGGRTGVDLSAAEGPMDYARRLLLRAPAKEAAIREAARVFETLVYGPAPDPKSERDLARLVDGIVR
jgi:hypothetical protein